MGSDQDIMYEAILKAMEPGFWARFRHRVFRHNRKRLWCFSCCGQKFDNRTALSGFAISQLREGVRDVLGGRLR